MMIDSVLGHYRVTARLGAGGMGEVYRATDTRLNREVALKILPANFTTDPDRLARFEREAQVLAQLQHPNIAAIFGVEETGATRALVMELVEGPTLADRLAGGALSLPECLAAARQIVEALEAAHEKGIVHRDLKPANIKFTAGGTVKVLDFGLAKAMDPASGGPVAPSTASLANSPTYASPMTEVGMIIGTAAYMAPEQARGKPVDRRADIWAFGVVLYEMLTGEHLFAGETVSDTIAGVLTREPDLRKLPAGTPAGVRRLLRWCLARDPRDRLRDIGDARFALAATDDSEAVVPIAARPAWRTWLPWSVAALVGALAASAIWGRRAPASEVGAEGHFTIELPGEAPLVTLEIPGVSEAPLAVSPDGRQVVYVAPSGSRTQLYVRAMGDLTPRALAGTEGARAPFFSPDGQWVGFFADGKLRKAPLAGGTPVILAEAPGGYGGSWSELGEILFAPHTASNLLAVSDAGGSPRPVTSLDFAAGDDSHAWPQVLPGGRLALFTVFSWSRETADILLVDLSTGARRIVQHEVGYARYVPSGPGAAAGHLVFVRGGALMAAPLDPAATGPAGPPVAIVDHVRDAQFAFSAKSVLAYTPGVGRPPDYSLVWVDRSGGVRLINDLPRGYEDLHLSPDGRRIALTIEEGGFDSSAHVWLADTERGTLTRLTFEGLSRDPVWRPDGEAVVFGSKRGDAEFGLYVQRIDGTTPAELIWRSPVPIWPDPQSWTPDGRMVIFTTKGKDTGDDIWTISLEDRTARPWLQTPATEWAGRLSPDGRWMAYNSDESGRTEVYVQPFPGPGGKRLVSQGGGLNPIWSRNGREIFYRAGDRVLKVDVDASSGFSVGKATVLFAGRYRATGRDFDVSADGTRFVMMRNDDPRTVTRLRVLLHWWRALDARSAHRHEAR